MERLTVIHQERLDRLSQLYSTNCLRSTVGINAENEARSAWYYLYFGNGSKATISTDSGSIYVMYLARIDEVLVVNSYSGWTCERLEEHYGDLVDNRIAELMERVSCKVCECIDCDCNECCCSAIAQCIDGEDYDDEQYREDR